MFTDFVGTQIRTSRLKELDAIEPFNVNEAMLVFGDGREPSRVHVRMYPETAGAMVGDAIGNPRKKGAGQEEGTAGKGGGLRRRPEKEGPDKLWMVDDATYGYGEEYQEGDGSLLFEDVTFVRQAYAAGDRERWNVVMRGRVVDNVEVQEVEQGWTVRRWWNEGTEWEDDDWTTREEAMTGCAEDVLQRRITVERRKRDGEG